MICLRERLLLTGWNLLALWRVGERTIRENERYNREIFRRTGVFSPDGYLENQAEWTQVRFGRNYTVAYGGCGAIAVYNALRTLGLADTLQDWEQIAAELQKTGAAGGGKYGLTVRAIVRFLREKGCVTEGAIGSFPEKLKRLEERNQVWIATVFNCPGRLREGLHTVCITRDAEGFWLHNAESARKAQGRYAARGPLKSLEEAVCKIAAGGADVADKSRVALAVIGLRVNS